MEKRKNIKEIDLYKCNHHHKITDNHKKVDFGDGEFIANKKAIPILKALNELGVKTRTHHIDGDGGFFSILIGGESRVNAEIKEVFEKDSVRTKYDGRTEIVISFTIKNGND